VSQAEIDRGLRGGDVGVALVIPPDFSRELHEGRTPPEVQILYDGAETVLAANAEGALRALVSASGARLVDQPTAGGGVGVATGVLYNPRLDGPPFTAAGVFRLVRSFPPRLITG